MTCRQWLSALQKHCGQPARFYRPGWRCPDHTPARQNGRPEPPDPKEPQS